MKKTLPFTVMLGSSSLMRQNSAAGFGEIATIADAAAAAGADGWHIPFMEGWAPVLLDYIRNEWKHPVLATLGFADLGREIAWIRALAGTGDVAISLHSRIVDSDECELALSLARLARRYAGRLVLSTRSPARLSGRRALLQEASAIMIPVNPVGHGLNMADGSLNRHLEHTRRMGEVYPIIGYSCLAGGQLSLDSLPFALNYCDAVILGVRDVRQAKETMEAAAGAFRGKNDSGDKSFPSIYSSRKGKTALRAASLPPALSMAGTVLNTWRDSPAETEKPRTVLIEATNACNCRCVHCFLARGVKRIDTASCLDFISALPRIGVGRVKITGGEPLLNPDWEKIIGQCRLLGLETTLCTNGMLLDKEKLASLKRNGVRVQISVDSVDKQTFENIRCGSSHKTLMDLLRMLADRMPGQWQCICTFLKENEEGFEDTLETILRYNPGGLAISHWKPSSPDGVDHSPSFLASCRFFTSSIFSANAHRLSGSVMHSLRKELLLSDESSRCILGRQWYVSVDGDIYACPQLVCEQGRIGHIAMNVDEIVGSGRTRDAQKRIDMRWKELTECQSCHWRGFCRGGCPGRAIAHSGALNAVDDLCALRQRLFPVALQELDRRLCRKM